MRHLHNHNPTEIYPELVEILKSAGIRHQIINVVDQKLALTPEEDPIFFTPELNDQAFRTVEAKTKQQVVNLADLILRNLELALEKDDDEGGRPPVQPPRVSRTTWTQLSPHLSPPEDQRPAPKTAEEIYDFLRCYTRSNLGGFHFTEERTRQLAQEAESLKEELENVYGLTPHEAVNLMKVSFYDIFFLCDNSGSMRFGTRVRALSDTLQAVSSWASKLNPAGISLRFLCHSDDESGKFDDLVSPDRINDLILNVPLRGPTRLGSMLQQKVIDPLSNRAQKSGGKIKPRIIVIVTDGQPSRERREFLREVIVDAKDVTLPDGLSAQFGPAVTVFLIAKVGNDKEAALYLDELESDEELSSLLFTFNRPLEGVYDMLAQAVGDGEDEKKQARVLWMKLFNAALNTQTISD